jgi:hypothetical protein
MQKNIDYDKLQDSLEYIKIVCENQKNGCEGCPLGDKYGICRLAISPKEWIPRHPDTDAFRVLE